MHPSCLSVTGQRLMPSHKEQHRQGVMELWNKVNLLTPGDKANPLEQA